MLDKKSFPLCYHRLSRQMKSKSKYVDICNVFSCALCVIDVIFVWFTGLFLLLHQGIIVLIQQMEVGIG